MPLILLPVYGSAHPKHLESLEILARDLVNNKMHSNVQLLRRYGLPIDQARNMLATIALQDYPDEDIFVFIDSDIQFKPKDFYRVCDLVMGSARRGVVSGSYIQKNRNGKLVGRAAEGAFIADNGLVECDRIGMGFCAIHRDALNAMTHILDLCSYDKFKVWPFFQPMIHDGEYLGEDYAFSQRALESGVGIYIDLNTRLIHWGEMGYGFSPNPEDSGNLGPSEGSGPKTPGPPFLYAKGASPDMADGVDSRKARMFMGRKAP